jgi:hypothetical protein
LAVVEMVLGVATVPVVGVGVLDVAGGVLLIT